MQVSLPPFFINGKQKHNLPSLRDLQQRLGGRDMIRDEIPRASKLTSRMAHTMKRILEEDPDADIDELDYISFF